MISNKKYALIDSRMRDIEKEYIESLGYTLICLNESNNVYYEVSSHVDIFCCKIDDILIVEPDTCNKIVEYIKDENSQKLDYNILKGKSVLKKDYPFDIAYNVCIIGSLAIHNFKYTDENIQRCLVEKGYKLINVAQGYSRCSISVIDENSCVTSDATIAKELIKNGVDVLYIPSNKMNIKLWKNNKEYSSMHGFIGGATSKIDNEYIVFGDIHNIDEEYRIKLQNFVEKRDIKLKYFKDMDIIDYGTVVTFN